MKVCKLKHIFWPNLFLVILRKVKGQCLERGWVYNPCLERGRWLNCGWNGFRGSKIVSKRMYQFHWSVPLTGVPPGLQIWYGIGELESKTHNFCMHFLFKQTYIQIMNIFHYLNLFVYYTEKNGVDKTVQIRLFGTGNN